MALKFLLRLLLITPVLQPIAAMPYPSGAQSPAINIPNKLFARQQSCPDIGCGNVGGARPIDRPECRWFNCGQCGTNGACIDLPGDYDNFDPDNPGNANGGGGGQAGNGEGSNDSSGTCVQDESDTAASGACPVEATSTKAQCGGACNTGGADTCGSGCGCNFSGAPFGGMDGICRALISFGTSVGG